MRIYHKPLLSTYALSSVPTQSYYIKSEKKRRKILISFNKALCLTNFQKGQSQKRKNATVNRITAWVEEKKGLETRKNWKGF